MHVYVANGTFQNIHFNYRLPEVGNIRTLEIRAGRQVKFPEDMNETQVLAIEKQLQRYGGHPVSDVKSITVPRALVYSVDRTIKSEKINEAREKDESARQEVAAQKLEDVGVTQFDTVEKYGDGSKVQKSAIEIEQLDSHGDLDLKGVNTEIVVSRKAGKREASRRRGE